jgi:hypothetical protein
MRTLGVASVTFVSLGLLTTLASADPRGPSPATPAIPQYPERAVCNGVNRCFAHARLAPDGSIQRTAVKPGDLPPGFGPTDLQSAYHIALPATTTATVAVIDAYGYPNLESDLATYRSTFSLPACSVASGCLTILNASGQTSPLPQEPPAQDDWTIETALDVDMVSAACPGCKIIVVEANDDTGDGLLTNNDIAAMMGATTISNSWGGPERIYEDSSQTLSSADAHVTHPGIAVFASAGDAGYQANGANFPTSSDHVISVGGTSLVNNGAGGRGWAESAWNLGGSSCSAFFAQPPWQKSSACSMRAYADVSAVGDPNTGVAVFNNGPSGSGWSIEGGTSLASPLVAAMFAQAGLGSSASSNFPYVNSGMFFDVTTGNNGSCGNSAICNAGLDWDGPTGIGSPIYPALAGTAKVPTLKVDPAPNQAVPDGFSATVTCTPTDSAHVTEVDVYVDGSQIGSLTAPPFVAKVPAGLPQGSHELYVVCELSSLATARADYTIDEVAACKTAGDCPKTGDICFDDACIPGKDLPNGLGAPCTDGSGCASGLCTGSDGLGTGSGSGDAGKVCTIDCDSNNACPSGFACTGSDSDGNPMCIEKPSSGGGCDSGGDGLPVVPLALGAGVLAFVLARRRTA